MERTTVHNRSCEKDEKKIEQKQDCDFLEQYKIANASARNKKL